MVFMQHSKIRYHLNITIVNHVTPNKIFPNVYVEFILQDTNLAIVKVVTNATVTITK